MNVMELLAKISLDSSEYDKGIGDSEKKFEGFGSKIASGAKTIGKIGVTAFTALGTAVVGTGTAMLSSANATAQYADNIDKMSQKMGMSAEAYQEWDFIMQHNGTTIEGMKASMKTLANAVETDSEAFAQLGLSQEELANMSQEEIFGATIEALQNVEDETQRTYLAGKLMGKGATELGALLNMSAEETEAMKQQVHDLGGVMSDEAVKAGASYQDSLQNLRTVLGGLKNNLMGEFLPSITSVMDGLTALFSGDESGIGKIQEGIESFASKLNERLPSVIQTISGVAESLVSSLPSLFETLAQQLPSILNQAIPVLINSLVAIGDAIVEALPELMKSIESNISVVSSGLSKILMSIGKLIVKLLPSLLKSILQCAVEIVKELANGISQNADEIVRSIIEVVNVIVEMLTNPDTLMQILDCGLQIIFALTEGLLNNLPLLLESVGTLILNIVTFLAESIPELIVQIGQFGAKIITDILPTLILNASEKLSELLGKIIEWIGGWGSSILSTAVEVFQSIGQGVLDAGSWIWEKVTGLGGDIIDWLWEGLESIGDLGLDIVKGLWQGIKDAGSWLKDKLFGWCDDVVDWCKDGFGIFSPSRRFKYLGRMNAEGLSVGFDDEAKNTFDDMQKTIDDGMEGLDLDPVSLSANSLVTSNLKVKTSSDPVSSAMNKLVAMYESLMENRGEMTFPIIVGGRQIDEVIIDSKNRVTTRSGGQVNA